MSGPVKSVGGEIAPELVERMVALVRGMVALPEASARPHGAAFEKAREIAALLPEPIDPDLIEAIALVNSKIDISGAATKAQHWAVQMALACIKRGRELAAKS